MSAICQVTGRSPGFGKQVSHSHRRTSRRWEPDLQGIESVVAELRAKGQRV